jgi:hypothetical protein
MGICVKSFAIFDFDQVLTRGSNGNLIKIYQCKISYERKTCGSRWHEGGKSNTYWLEVSECGFISDNLSKLLINWTCSNKKFLLNERVGSNDSKRSHSNAVNGS